MLQKFPDFSLLSRTWPRSEIWPLTTPPECLSRQRSITDRRRQVRQSPTRRSPPLTDWPRRALPPLGNADDRAASRCRAANGGELDLPGRPSFSSISNCSTASTAIDAISPARGRRGVGRTGRSRRTAPHPSSRRSTDELFPHRRAPGRQYVAPRCRHAVSLIGAHAARETALRHRSLPSSRASVSRSDRAHLLALLGMILTQAAA